jgi:hypothetical protein
MLVAFSPGSVWLIDSSSTKVRSSSQRLRTTRPVRR